MSNIPPKPLYKDFTNPRTHRFMRMSFTVAMGRYHEARAERAIEALTKMAEFNDFHGNEELKKTGSYLEFEFPWHVEISRKALADIAATDTGEQNAGK